MTEKIYKVRCVDDKLYLVHHGVSDFIGLDDMNINEKAIIQISHYLNEQEEIIQKYKHLIKIATSIIEWNTVPQIRRAWQNYLNKVGDLK